MTKKTEQLTNPYAALEFVIGDENDFICFDYHTDKENKRILLHAVINCETSHFIQNFEPPYWVNYADDLLAPYHAAKRMVEAALDWCGENDVKHDVDGWNQDEGYFPRAVHASLTNNGPAIRKATKMKRAIINTRIYL